MEQQKTVSVVLGTNCVIWEAMFAVGGGRLFTPTHPPLSYDLGREVIAENRPLKPK